MNNRLKELRHSKGLTIRELGEQLNVWHTTVSQIENGKRNFSVESLLKIADYFEVSIDYLLCRDAYVGITTKKDEE